MELPTIGVVGCGLMGSGIAEVFARAGCAVLVHEADATAAARGRDGIAASLRRAVSSGKLSQEDADAASARIEIGTDLSVLAPVQLCIEAVSEDEGTKIALFHELDQVVESVDAILASNTSSIPIMKLGTATSRPHQVIGMHFFNPAPVLPLVELVPSLLTSAEVEATVRGLAEGLLGKTVIRSPDRAGFIVNALLVPYLLSAIRMVESGFASPADIDAGMVSGCAYRMGPLRLSGPHRCRYGGGHRVLDVLGVQGAAVLAAADATADGRCRVARTQERARLLRLRFGMRHPGSPGGPAIGSADSQARTALSSAPSAGGAPW